MHHLLAVLSLATALVAPPRRQTLSTRLRATSLEKKGDDYIFDDIAKNLGKGDQDRLYQYQLELAERYGEDKIGRAAPPPKPKKPKQGAAVVEAVTTPRATKVAVQRNSKLRWRGLVCGAAVALFLTPGFLEYLISVRTKALALEKSLEALVVAVAAPATDALSAACGAATATTSASSDFSKASALVRTVIRYSKKPGAKNNATTAPHARPRQRSLEFRCATAFVAGVTALTTASRAASTTAAPCFGFLGFGGGAARPILSSP